MSESSDLTFPSTSTYTDNSNSCSTENDPNKSEYAGRMKGVVMVKPIVYGSIAQHLSEKRADGRTHKWTVFLKPYNNEDLSVFVKKVHFKLHDSYTNCNRTITKPPYEVSETGWGEFEIVIKIFFEDPNERPVTVYHVLKLFHSGANANDPIMSKKPVISENFDEIIFQDPTALMKNLLSNPVPYTNGVWVHDTDFEILTRDTVHKLQLAKNDVKKQLDEYKLKLKIAQQTIAEFKEEVSNTTKSSTPITSYLTPVNF